MFQQLTPKHSAIILKEMCRRVGLTGKAYKDFDFTKSHWFSEYEWTEEEEDKFTDWLADFLEQHKYCPKNATKRGLRWAKYEAGKINLAMGWKTKYS